MVTSKKQKPVVKPSEVLLELRSRNSKSFLLQREVLELVRLSRVEVYRRYLRGEFPVPRRQGNRTLVWKASDVYAWMDNLPLATKAPHKVGG